MQPPKPPKPPKPGQSGPPQPGIIPIITQVSSGPGTTNPNVNGGGASNGGGYGSAPPSFDNTAQAQPDMSWAIEEMKKRYGTDMGAGRAIDIAGGKIREAGIGVERARTGDAARRGVSGTGAEYNLRKQDSNAVLNDISGAATSITQDRENQKDSMLQRILGGGQAMGSLAQGDRSLALGSWQAYEHNQREKEQAMLARQMALLGLLNGGN